MSELLRVVLDDRPLRRTLTGVGNYIVQLLLHAPEHAPDTRLTPFVFTYLRRGGWKQVLEPQADAPPQAPHDVGGSRRPWWIRAGLQWGYGAALRTLTRGRFDVYHQPNHIPARCGLPTVTTIHDLSVVVHPEWHPEDRVRWYDRDFERGVRQTHVFLAASEFTKRELIERAGVAAEQILVACQAARDAFTPQPTAFVERTLGALSLPRTFFLYVGTLEPRKNVPGLLDAFARLPAAVRKRHPLVVVGAWGWKAEKLREQMSARSLGGEVLLPGFVSDRQLAALYTACTGFVWPTFYEGFGLPPLEAMACGAPVVVSDVASLPEVVGEAGVRLDPGAPEPWTAAMQRLAEDAEHRAALGERSQAQAARFGWGQFVRQTVDAYRRAVEG